MKKQFNYLMMVFALVILAGTSAMAQVGTDADPFWHVNGSTHTLTVTNVPGNTYAWTTADAGAVLTTFSGIATNQATITWDDAAAGLYHFRVTETGPAACQVTVREVTVAVLNFDVYAYYSDANGGNVEADAAVMTACSEGTVANYNDLVGAFSQEVQVDGTGTVGDLSDQIGTSVPTLRYISFLITWGTPSVGSFTPPVIGSLELDFDITLTDPDATFVSFNGVGSNSGNTSFTPNAAVASGLVFTGELEYNAQWGIPNVTAFLAASNCQIFDGTATLIGDELALNVTGVGTPTQNTTATQTIQSAPATSVITVAP